MTEKCSNCGGSLTEQQVELALNDIGGDIRRKEVAFCCSTYTDKGGCQGNDESEMAYWYTH